MRRKGGTYSQISHTIWSNRGGSYQLPPLPSPGNSDLDYLAPGGRVWDNQDPSISYGSHSDASWLSKCGSRKMATIFLKSKSLHQRAIQRTTSEQRATRTAHSRIWATQDARNQGCLAAAQPQKHKPRWRRISLIRTHPRSRRLRRPVGPGRHPLGTRARLGTRIC